MGSALGSVLNGFSKKWENLWAALCLHFAYYNFCKIHRTLRVTPAMQAGITDRVWDNFRTPNDRLADKAARRTRVK